MHIHFGFGFMNLLPNQRSSAMGGNGWSIAKEKISSPVPGSQTWAFYPQSLTTTLSFSTVFIINNIAFASRHCPPRISLDWFTLIFDGKRAEKIFFVLRDPNSRPIHQVPVVQSELMPLLTLRILNKSGGLHKLWVNYNSLLTRLQWSGMVNQLEKIISFFSGIRTRALSQLQNAHTQWWKYNSGESW